VTTYAYNGPRLWGTVIGHYTQRIADMAAAGGKLNFLRDYLRIADTNTALTPTQVALHNKGHLLGLSLRINGCTYVDARTLPRYVAKVDSYIDSALALDFTSPGKPRYVFLSVQHEMDAKGAQSAGTPAQAVDFQQWFYERLRSKTGHEHALVAWCTTGMYGATHRLDGHPCTPGPDSRITAYYPDDDHCDLVMGDPYDYTLDVARWIYFPALFNPMATWVHNTGLAVGKQQGCYEIGVPDTGSASDAAYWMKRFKDALAAWADDPVAPFILASYFDRPDTRSTGFNFELATSTAKLQGWVAAGLAWEKLPDVGGPPPATDVPTAAFTYTAPSGATPVTVAFDATSSTPSTGETITARAWEFGDGGTGTGVTPSHTYAADGTYLAKLTVTQSNGKTDTQVLAVSVGAEPPPPPPSDGFPPPDPTYDADDPGGGPTDGQLTGVGNLAGTLTLRIDPQQGSRFRIRAGQNIRVRNLQGRDVLFHVVHAAHDPASLTTTLMVDERARDLPTLAAIIARNKEAKTDPARRLIRNQQGKATQDTVVQWNCENGAGVMQRMALYSRLWSVFAVSAAQVGQIVEVHARTEPATRFAFGIFSRRPTSNDMNLIVGDPLADSGVGSFGKFTVENERLLDFGVIECWGQFDQACGYWPLAETDNQGNKVAPLTGKMKDVGGWNYECETPPFLWVAVWAEDSTFFEGRLEQLQTDI
jgi:PKD repeat protein